MKITFNGEPRDIADRMTVAQLLQQIQVAPRQVAVEVNLEVAPRAQHEQWILQEGDRVEIVTLVGGG